MADFDEGKITHWANGPWNTSRNFIFPTKYVVPKSLSRLARKAK